MKRIFIVTILSGFLIPSIASAELNYDAVEVGYLKTTQSGVADLTLSQVGISKSITSNVFLEAAYATGSQASGTTQGDIKTDGFSVGAGYHTPIQKDVDFIISADLARATAKQGGVSKTANAYGVGVGIRAELTPIIETIVSGTYTHASANSSTTSSTGIRAELGFKVTPVIQLNVNISADSNSPSSGSSYSTNTIGFGARFYY